MSISRTAPPPAPFPPRLAPRGRPGHIEVGQLPAPLEGSIAVRAWADDYLAVYGHDVRSSYVELFWLGILGPSSTVLLRRLANGLEHAPDGYRLPIVDTARSLGLGPPKGRNAPFIRALHRCVIFRVARFVGADVEVRMRLPTLHAAQLARLPESLQAAHALVVARHAGSLGRPDDVAASGPSGRLDAPRPGDGGEAADGRTTGCRLPTADCR